MKLATLGPSGNPGSTPSEPAEPVLAHLELDSCQVMTEYLSRLDACLYNVALAIPKVLEQYLIVHIGYSDWPPSRGWGRYRQRGRYFQGRYIQWALEFQPVYDNFVKTATKVL